MQNNKCSQCGFVAQTGTEFCVNCGRELTQPAASSGVQEATQPQLYSIQPFTSVGAVLGPTLKIFTKNFWLISKLVFVIFAPLEVIKVWSAQDVVQGNWHILGSTVFWLICNALIAPSLIYALVTQMRTGVTPSLHESYRWGLRRLLPFIACVTLSWVLVTAGFFLLIVPGVILALAFELVQPVASLETRVGPVEVLKRSYNLTKGYWGNIFGARLVLGLLCIAVSFPISALSTVLVAEGIGFWPLQAALALIVDIISEVSTVLMLVIYLSILSTAFARENAESRSIAYER